MTESPIILLPDGTERINVLDKGYVRKIGTFGSDLNVANAARVSYDKESPELSKRDERLIKFLWDNDHTSPFRQCLFQFEVYAPLMVARQWWKYIVGSDHTLDSWNESCLPATQVVNLWDGGTRTIGDLQNDSNVNIRSVDHDGYIVPNRIKRIWSVGNHTVYRLTTLEGHSVDMTGTHRVLTNVGWRKLKDLNVGTEIAFDSLGVGVQDGRISFSEILSIEDRGTEEVFDVEMDLEPNFVAGNIVIHNSRRYVTEKPTFYIPKPNQWRSKPEDSKQGSGAMMDVDDDTCDMTDDLYSYIQHGEDLYERAMALGVAPEQARLFLPSYGMYVRWRWTGTLQSAMHFLEQRLAHDAQAEIQAYARAVYDLLYPDFPAALKQLNT